MSTKITVTADASQATQELGKVTGSLSALEHEALDTAARSASALESIEQALKDIASQSNKTDQAMEKVGSGGGAATVTALSTGFLAVTKGLQLTGQAAQKAMQAINFLADSGSPSAIKLRDSITGVQEALIKLADDPSVASLADKLAGLGDRAAEGIGDLPDLYRDAVNAISGAMVQGAEAVGLAAEGTLETLREMEEQEQKSIANAEKQIAAEKEMLQIKKQQGDLEKSLQAIDDQQMEEEYQKQLKRLEAEEEINALIADRRRELQELADAGKLDDAARTDGLKKLAIEYGRLNEIRAEGEQKRKDAAKQAADDEKKRKDEIDKQTEAIREQDRAREAAARADKEREQQAEIEKQQKALQDSGAAAALNQQAADPRAVAQRLAQQRADAARNELYKSGEQDSNKLDAAAEAARRQAFRQAMNQANGGKQSFSQEEVSGAIEQNAQSQVQQMQQTGNFSNSALQALNQAAAEQRRQSQEMTALQEQLAQIQAFQNGTTQDGERRRAQRAGNRQ